MGYQSNNNGNQEYGYSSGESGSAGAGCGSNWRSGGAVPPPFPGESQQRAPYPPRGYGYAPRDAMHKSESNGIGTAGFILALLSFLGYSLPFVGFVGGLTWLLGLIFSVIGVTRRPRGLAISRLVISIIGLLIGIIAVLFFNFLIARDGVFIEF